jgi:hypothetical protein
MKYFPRIQLFLLRHVRKKWRGKNEFFNYVYTKEHAVINGWAGSLKLGFRRGSASNTLTHTYALTASVFTWYALRTLAIAPVSLPQSSLGTHSEHLQ